MSILHQLGIDPKVIAAQVTGFLLLWLVLKRFLFGPVISLLDERKQDIKATYDKAEAERAQAEEFRSGYEKRLADVEAEARRRLQAAVKEAEAAKSQIITEARSQSGEILRRGQEQLDREREKTLAEIREEVVNISLSAAGKLIGESMDDQKHRKLIGEFVDKIGAAE